MKLKKTTKSLIVIWEGKIREMAFFEGNNMTGGYGDGPDIINSCSINVNKGEIVAILGPNGAGKSTAMKAMLGLLKLKSGNITIGCLLYTSPSPRDRG